MLAERTVSAWPVSYGELYCECELLTSGTDIPDAGEVIVYGLCLRSYDLRGKLLDEAEIADISSRRELVEGLRLALLRNAVTPLSLRDVTEDFLASL